MKCLPMVLLMGWFVSVSLAAVQGLCEGCAWTERGDRFEGVHEEATMISGASFELVSVRYRGETASAAGDTSLRLSFWLPEAQTLDELLVWRPLPSRTGDKVAYKMAPNQKALGAGRREFTWPRAEVLDRLGIPPAALHVRIKAGPAYLPGLLAAGLPPSAPAGYVFVFQSGAGIDTVCSLWREGAAEPVRKLEWYVEDGGELSLEWDGRDERGGLVPDGLYVLKIEGDMLAEVLRPLEKTVRFWHRNQIEK